MNALFEQLGGPALQVGVFVMVAATFTFLLIGLRGIIVSQEDPMRRRIERAASPKEERAHRVLRAPAGKPTLADAAMRPLAVMARPTDEEELEGLRSRLSHAGYRSEQALIRFLFSKVALCLMGAGLVWAYNTWRIQPTDKFALYVILAMIVGFYGPNLWLMGRIQERQTALNHALPDVMDLLVTCVEAGLGLEAALNRVASELKLSAPLLASELSQSAVEMRAGLSRGEAFRRLANRTGLDELKYLASIIVQVELFGTSIARSLRVMSDSMRTRRTQIAEKNAAQASVKMTIPLILFILPSLFTFVLGPAAINIARILLPTLGGGSSE